MLAKSCDVSNDQPIVRPMLQAMDDLRIALDQSIAQSNTDAREMLVSLIIELAKEIDKLDGSHSHNDNIL